MNLKALIVFEKQEERDLWTFFLEGCFNFEVYAVSNFQEALVLLDLEEKLFQWIICYNYSSAQKLIALSFGKNLPTRFICLNSSVPEDPFFLKRKEQIYFFHPNVGISQIDEFLLKTLEAQFQNKNKNSNSYCRIKINLLLHASPLITDIYSLSSDEKVSMVKPKGLDFDLKDYETFKNLRAIDYLYLEKQFCLEIAIQVQNSLKIDQLSEFEESSLVPIGSMNQALIQVLEEKKERLIFLEQKLFDIKQKKQDLFQRENGTAKTILEHSAPPNHVQLQTSSIPVPVFQIENQLSDDQFTHEVKKEPEKQKQTEERRQKLLEEVQKRLISEVDSIYSLSNQLGFNEEVQELTRQSVLNTINKMKQAPKLSSVLVRLEHDEKKYIASHSILLAFVSCAIASQLEWSSDTTSYKLTLASFLHDITLKNQELALVQSLPELREKQSLFTDEEMKAFYNHPADAAACAQKFDEIPADVDLILSQHHERPDGSGFPKGLTSTRISPLSVVFIIAHDLVHYVLEKNKSETKISEADLKKFVADYPPQYIIGNFKRVLATVSKMKT